MKNMVDTLAEIFVLVLSGGKEWKPCEGLEKNIVRSYAHIYEARAKFYAAQDKVPHLRKGRSLVLDAIVEGLGSVPQRLGTTLPAGQKLAAVATAHKSTMDDEIAKGYAELVNTAKTKYAEVHTLLSQQKGQVHLEINLVSYDKGKTFNVYVTNPINHVQFAFLLYNIVGSAPTLWKFEDDDGRYSDR